MTTRRDFLQASAIIGAAGMGGGARASFGIIGAPEPRLLIADRRYPASRAFGGAAAAGGRTVVMTGGDVSGLWTGRLRALWQDGEAEIAGMTGYDVLFCLERFAWDHRHCVIALVDHVPDAAGGYQHVARTSSCERLAEALAAARADFPGFQAQALGVFDPEPSRCPPSHAPGKGMGGEPLASWIIAPRSRIRLTGASA
ncbi:twin-arginine translocation signal domain-containing protein [Sphingomonas sp.]|uniref:twin-arginine translocation signal domain-containing protein n=1 Tax=Sphingomonas sp. TaxID=28214 RepID=UPI0025D1F224|nr:twin-arginine translocation signal domain-containing protein [Sphingomonas sp.]